MPTYIRSSIRKCLASNFRKGCLNNSKDSRNPFNGYRLLIPFESRGLTLKINTKKNVITMLTEPKLTRRWNYSPGVKKGRGIFTSQFRGSSVSLKCNLWCMWSPFVLSSCINLVQSCNVARCVQESIYQKTRTIMNVCQVWSKLKLKFKEKNLLDYGLKTLNTFKFQ